MGERKRETERERERERKRERERERRGEFVRMGKERKRAKRNRNSNIFKVVRKYRGGNSNKKRGHKGPESIFHCNKQNDKEI